SARSNRFLPHRSTSIHRCLLHFLTDKTTRTPAQVRQDSAPLARLRATKNSSRHSPPESALPRTRLHRLQPSPRKKAIVARWGSVPRSLRPAREYTALLCHKKCP